MYLMCKNNCLMDLTTFKVYNPDLLPGRLRLDPTRMGFERWMQMRRSAGTNSFSRVLLGTSFGQGRTRKADLKTHALSLSDAYWVTEDLNLRFEDISPYYQDFWNGTGAYAGQSIPSLYVDGALSKAWQSSNILAKKLVENEAFALALANVVLTTPVCEVVHVSKDLLYVKNFTSPNEMFESAAMSGKINLESFEDATIIELFGISGLEMLTIDAIVGNGDRHAGNFGFMRSTDNGAYLRPAPIFDFDHAGDTKLEDDVLIRELVFTLRLLPRLIPYAQHICTETLRTNIGPEFFQVRAKSILARLASNDLK